MSRANWEVIPGEGELYLDQMTRSMGAWHQYRDELPSLEANAEYWKTVAEACVGGVVMHAFDSPDGIEATILELTEDGTEAAKTIARTEAYGRAAHKLNQIRTGEYYAGLSYRRARLTVVEPGVIVEERKALLPGWTSVFAHQHEAVPGEVFEGNHPSLASEPEDGGSLSFEPSRRKVLIVTGLIDVDRVEPRVELEILRNTSR